MKIGSLGVLRLLAALACLWPATAAAADPYAYISPKLPPSEQKMMAAVLARMPLAEQRAIAARAPEDVHIMVIDGSTDAIYVNRPEDVRRVRTGPAEAIDSHLGPSGNFDPGYNATTGPYRRIYTAPVPAIPMADALNGAPYGNAGIVSTPCKAGNFVTAGGKQDNGNVYLGGWSTLPNSAGGAIDAGLLYNYELNPPKSHDDYSPYIALGGGKFYSETLYRKVVGHVACGADPPETQLVFSVRPYTTSPDISSNCDLTQPQTCQRYDMQLTTDGKGYLSHIEYISPPADARGILRGGWGQVVATTDNQYAAITPCGNCIFKWMTTIAQQQPGYYSDGSRFTATWSERYISCWVVGDCEAGADSGLDMDPVTANEVRCSEFPLWHGGVYKNGMRDCTNTPAGTRGEALDVQVSGYSADGETDTINLVH